MSTSTMSAWTWLLAATLSLTAVSPASAQWLVAPQPGNQVSVVVLPVITFDPVTSNYTYDYVLKSLLTSKQNVVGFALSLPCPANLTQSPQGWTGRKWQSEPIVSWTATEAEPDPPGFVDDGSLPLAARSIRPGQIQGGFRIVSAHPPSVVQYYAQGETPLPVLAPDFDADDFEEHDRTITVDGASGVTLGPAPCLLPPI